MSPQPPQIPIDFTPFLNAVSPPVVFWQSLSVSPIFVALETFLLFLSAVFFVGIVSLVVKTNAINTRLNKAKKIEGVRLKNFKSKRFEVVEKHMESSNPAEWRLAIIEADALLEEMVKKMGYEGTTLGETLKNIEVSDFTTLNDAWEAHKVRNQIAHQGSSFLLTAREAKRVIRLYEKVFREFDII